MERVYSYNPGARTGLMAGGYRCHRADERLGNISTTTGALVVKGKVSQVRFRLEDPQVSLVEQVYGL